MLSWISVCVLFVAYQSNVHRTSFSIGVLFLPSSKQSVSWQFQSCHSRCQMNFMCNSWATLTPSHCMNWAVLILSHEHFSSRHHLNWSLEAQHVFFKVISKYQMSLGYLGKVLHIRIIRNIYGWIHIVFYM